MRVDRHVRERVGAAVLLPLDVRDRDVGNPAQELRGALVEGHELGRLDPVAAVHLLHDELGVEVDLQAVRLPVLYSLQTLDQRVVLGLVVGRDAKPPVEAAQAHSVLVLDHHADAGRAGIAARRAVGEEPKNLQAITRIRLQFSQLTTTCPLRSACMPEDVTVTWHARHWLWSTSATCGWARTRRYAFCAAGATCAHT